MTGQVTPVQPVYSAAQLWWLAARPKTLLLSLGPVALATALAAAAGSQQLIAAALAAAGAMALQVGTNFINDWADAARGADASDRLGPLRVSQTGLLPVAAVRRAGWCAFAVATACGLGLLYFGGWVLVAVGVASLLAGYSYTAGPYPLAYHGLGELFAWLFFGPVAVGTAYYLQAGAVSATSLWLGAAVGSFAAAVLAINNLRDLNEDAKVGKATLAVRLGPSWARWLLWAMLLLPYAITAALLAARQLPIACSLSLCSATLAVAIAVRCQRARGMALNDLLARTARLQLGYCLLLCVGLLA